MTAESNLIHQSLRDRSAEAERDDGPGRRIACGADIRDPNINHSAICAHVTCPKCLEWQKNVIEAVFSPLSG